MSKFPQNVSLRNLEYIDNSKFTYCFKWEIGSENGAHLISELFEEGSLIKWQDRFINFTWNGHSLKEHASE